MSQTVNNTETSHLVTPEGVKTYEVVMFFPGSDYTPLNLIAGASYSFSVVSLGPGAERSAKIDTVPANIEVLDLPGAPTSVRWSNQPPPPHWLCHRNHHPPSPL